MGPQIFFFFSQECVSIYKDIFLNGHTEASINILNLLHTILEIHSQNYHSSTCIYYSKEKVVSSTIIRMEGNPYN